MKLDIMAHACSPRILDAAAEGFQVQGQHRSHEKEVISKSDHYYVKEMNTERIGRGQGAEPEGNRKTRGLLQPFSWLRIRAWLCWFLHMCLFILCHGIMWKSKDSLEELLLLLLLCGLQKVIGIKVRLLDLATSSIGH
jgi:hypothetical protein